MNIGMGIPMNMMNMNNKMMGMENDEEWMKGFKMGLEEVNNSGEEINESSSTVPKNNIIFRATQGVSYTLVVDYGTTIDKLLKKYLKRTNRSDLEKSNNISFLFNARRLKFGDQTKIEDFFKDITNPKVVVNDVNNLSFC